MTPPTRNPMPAFARFFYGATLRPKQPGRRFGPAPTSDTLRPPAQRTLEPMPRPVRERVYREQTGRVTVHLATKGSVVVVDDGLTPRQRRRAEKKELAGLGRRLALAVEDALAHEPAREVTA